MCLCWEGSEDDSCSPCVSPCIMANSHEGGRAAGGVHCNTLNSAVISSSAHRREQMRWFKKGQRLNWLSGWKLISCKVKFQSIQSLWEVTPTHLTLYLESKVYLHCILNVIYAYIPIYTESLRPHWKIKSSNSNFNLEMRSPNGNKHWRLYIQIKIA